ncbi:MAG: hypothetical protein V1844_07350 [Pseudomonadota bacterium]
MLTRERIKIYLEELNSLLEKMDVKGEICLYGGAVMSLVFKARPSTMNVDAVFEPSSKIREAARQIAEDYLLRPDWLNDGVKGFVGEHQQKILYNWPNLKVYYPDPEYMLAMKAMSARVDSMDKKDIQFLINKLGILSSDDLFQIIEKYYRKQQIRPAVQYFIMELFDE